MRHAVILGGGGGTRLWPASRRGRPKQFLSVGTGGESLLAATWRRTSLLAAPGGSVVVTTAAHAARTARELPAATVIVEPVARNTAAALGLAAVHLAARDPDAVLAAFPADHHVGDDAEFRAVAGRALSAAESTGSIVTIGIVPSRPETAYGYLDVGAETDTAGVHRVSRFVEKPDLATAEAYVRSGHHLWNSGMVFCRADLLLAEIGRHQPDTFAALAEIRDALVADGEAAANATAARVYPRLTAVSIDYAVLEKTDGVLTIPGSFAWNDVGSWSALADCLPADSDGNVVDGVAILHDARRNIVVGDGDRVITVIGVDDLVIVQADDAILVVPRSRAQEVRDAVDRMQRNHLDRFL
jgi:mannose-1-phosphate guanylyltransferase